MLSAVKFESSLGPVYFFPNLQNAWSRWASCRTSKGGELHSQGNAKETESTSTSLRSPETPSWLAHVGKQPSIWFHDIRLPEPPPPTTSTVQVHCPLWRCPCPDPHWWEGLPLPWESGQLVQWPGWPLPRPSRCPGGPRLCPAHGCLVLAILCLSAGSALRRGFWSFSPTPTFSQLLPKPPKWTHK